jgi:uncharacterized protein
MEQGYSVQVFNLRSCTFICMIVIDPEWILLYIALGSVVGFCAGLFGIGGGGIMVPVLTMFFVMQDFPSQHVVHAALATSMAAIVATSFSSLRAHHRHDAVLWGTVWRIAPGILVGTFGAAWLTAFISSRALAIFFVGFMFYVALRMFLNIKPKPSRNLPGAPVLSIVGTGIGGVSALAAIGGGSLTVPFLTWCNVDIRKAVGTSAAVGFPIAIAGTAGYLTGGWSVQGVPPYTLGYIYLPAVIAIALMSMLTAPMGARMAHKVPGGLLKKLFAGLLLFLCLNMLYSVFSG